MTIHKAMTAALSGGSLAALLMLAPAPAHADGIYVSGFGGLSVQPKQVSTEIVADTGAIPTQFAVKFDPGFLVGGGIGYAFAGTDYGRFRVEAELSYRQNSVKRGTLDGNPVSFQGDNSSLAGILMVYYDLTGVSELFQPYVGAGVGLAGVESDATFELFGSGVLGLGGPTDTEIAWQVAGGVTVPIDRSFDLFVDGRYYATSNPDWTTDLVTSGTGRFASEFKTWHISAGFRFHF